MASQATVFYTSLVRQLVLVVDLSEQHKTSLVPYFLAEACITDKVSVLSLCSIMQNLRLWIF